MVIAFAFLTDRTDGVHPLLRLISLNAGQQFFFQPGPALLEPLNFAPAPCAAGRAAIACLPSGALGS
jgi:hypothetical protein